jgi:hypothetical protein
VFDEIEDATAVNMGADSWTRMERAIRVKFTLANGSPQGIPRRHRPTIAHEFSG